MSRTTLVALVIGFSLSGSAFGQNEAFYGGVNITGALTRTAVVNASQTGFTLFRTFSSKSLGPEFKPNFARPLPPRLSQPADGTEKKFAAQLMQERSASQVLAAAPPMQSLAVSPTTTATGFLGLTHLDQRLANNGNQFSIEPPSPSIAVGNGYVLEGVNNAINVYSVSGTPMLPMVISTNQLFGVPAAIDRITGLNGVYGTDMRVFYDHSINRWFVLQRAQDYDVFGGFPLNSSHIYLAVSQTGDPTGTWNIYTMDTTNANPRHPGCPCFSDFPSIGADKYGFYISSNEYGTFFNQFVSATILAISKASLAAGVVSPTTYEIVVPTFTGHEFTIQPATTPPGASYFVASGGLEYFVSTQARFPDSTLAVWALTNTASLNTAQPFLTLIRTTIPTLPYFFPDLATQKPGPLTLSPTGPLELLDGGDTRILSLVYAGGRLYATLASGVVDETGRPLVGGAYIIVSPAYRAGTLSARVFREGYLLTRNNHLLRPAVAVNPQGRGAIAFTLVGPDYYPGAAFVPFDTFATGSTIEIVGHGAFPEDGFTGYPAFGGFGIARWGDYSGAVATNDGSIWMVTEYIPDAPRTQHANWGTYVIRYQP
jgi:hypothetical protein